MAQVLVVEPDRQLRGFIAGILADLGHHVTGCADIEEAHNSLRGSRFDVLATDLTLGAKAAGALGWPPQLRLLTLIGRPAGGAAERPPRLCDKPFRFTDLHALVAAVAAGAYGVRANRR